MTRGTDVLPQSRRLAAAVAALALLLLLPVAASAQEDGPALEVSKTTDLDPEGELVTITGSGYDESKGIYVALCVIPEEGQPPTPCVGEVSMTGDTTQQAWITSNPLPGTEGIVTPFGPGGTFEVELEIIAADDSTNCLEVDCAIVSRADHRFPGDRSQDVIVPVTWADGTDPEPQRDVVRVAGPGRFETAAAVSAAAFPEGARYAFVATGNDYPDALAGGAAAGAAGVPVLLTAPDALPEATRAELERLGVESVIVLGGVNAVSEAVAAELAAFGQVIRVAGDSRFATAAAIAQTGWQGGAERVFVATGNDYPDALAGAAVAGALGGPVLLVTADAVPEATRAELERLAPERITILGGVNAVSEAVEAELATLATTDRIAGSSRFETAAAVAGELPPAEVVYVATGANFPDALAASAAAGAQDAPVLLVSADQVPPATATYLVEVDPATVIAVGGPQAISDEVLEALAG